MLEKIKIIIKAWKTASKPNKEEEKTARYRLLMCAACPHEKRKFFIKYCGLCWCPLSKKVYVRDKDSCEEGRWKF